MLKLVVLALLALATPALAHEKMAFHFDAVPALLFKGWRVETLGEYIYTSVATIAMAVLREYLQAWRNSRAKQQQQGSWLDLVCMLSNLVLAYLVMLIVMVYNVYLFLVPLFGAALGHYLFSIKGLLLPTANNDFNEHGEIDQGCCEN
ncbi:MAG: hypothetical protein MHM6MM_001891 [Cercozoa sp. M6MM]